MIRAYAGDDQAVLFDVVDQPDVVRIPTPAAHPSEDSAAEPSEVSARNLQ